MMKKIALLLISLLVVFISVAQTDQRDYEQEWQRFDDYLKKHRIIDCQDRLDTIEEWAIEDQKENELFRVQFERARIIACYNENKLPDAIFYLDSLLQTAQPPYSNIFNFLIAECLSAYLVDHFKTINERTHVDNNNLREFESWSHFTFTQAISNYLFKALEHLETTAALKSENFDFLLSKKEDIRPLIPTLFDVITQSFLQSITSSSNSYWQFKELIREYPQLLQPCPEFLTIDLDSITENACQSAKVFFTLLQNVFRYHNNQNDVQTNVLIDYELLKLNYLKNFLEDNHLEENAQYFKILEMLDNQYKNTAGYSAIQYQKALFYFDLAKQSKQDDAKSCIQQKSRALFDEILLSPSVFYSKNALHYLGILNTKELKSRGNETYYTSDRNLLVPITYTNLDSIYLSVYKINPNEFLVKKFSPYEKNIDSSFFDFITNNRNSEYVRTELIYLLNPYNFKSHSTDILLQNMEAGNYYLVFHSDKEPEEKNILTCIRTIATLTKINILNNNPQYNISAVNSETGKPLHRVKLTFFRKFVNSYKKTNSKGDVILNKWGRTPIYGFSVQNGEDSYYTNDNFYYYRSGYARRGMTRSRNSRNIAVFTDRTIYRPGQTAYFKAIYYGKHKVLKNREVQIELKDPDRQSIETINLKTNSFGSIDSSFLLPATGKTGGFTIFAKSKGSLSRQSIEYIQVEEYKRPNFEIEFERLQEEYKLGDSLEIPGYAKTFSGAVLSNATVKYSISSNCKELEIVSGEIFTDSKGKFAIPFEAKIPEELTTQSIRYTVKIDITDANGETQSKEKHFTAYKNSIRLLYHMDDFNLFHLKQIKDTACALKVSVFNSDVNEISSTVSAQIEQLRFPEKIHQNFNTSQPDYPILSQAEYQTFFPHLSYEKPDVNRNQWEVITTVFNQTFNSLEDSLRISGFSAWMPGMYRLILTTTDRNNNLVTDTSYFKAVDVTDHNPATYQAVSVQIPSEDIQTGKTLKIGISSMLKEAWVHCIVQKNNRIKKSFWVYLNQEQKVIEYKVRKNDRGYLRVLATVTQHGKTSQAYEQVNIYKPAKKISKHKLKRQHPLLNIETEHITNPLTPGEKEGWRFKISNLYSKQHAEVLAFMYDYSLDKLAPHSPAYFGYSYRYRKNVNRTSFKNYSPNLLKDNLYFNKKSLPLLLNKNYETVSLFYRSGYDTRYHNFMLNNLINKWRETQYAAVPSYSKSSITPYHGSYSGASTIKGLIRDFDGNAIPFLQVLLKQDGRTVNGAYTDEQGAYQIFGIPAGIYDISAGGTMTCMSTYTKTGIYVSSSEVKFIDLEVKCSSTEWNEVEVRYIPPVFSCDNTSVLSGDEVRKTPGHSIARGRRGSPTTIIDGVRVRENSPPPVSFVKYKTPEISDNIGSMFNLPFEFSQNIRIRKNFNETVFFLPNILTDKDGNFVVEFTAPEALTKWKFFAFAHTKDKRMGIIENFFQTQKTLMLMPNRPRFLREADTMAFSVKIANLSDEVLNGKAKIEFFNALNNQPVEILLDKNTQIQDFSCDKNTAVEWWIVVPKNISAISYKVVAQSGNYSDGEEYLLPVLPNRTLTTESLPIYVNGKSSKTFTFDKLQNHNSTTLDNYSYTLEFTANPAWYAILSLPYLMEYRYDCNEQIFSKLYANAIGAHIVNSNPKIKEVFEAWSESDASVFDSKLIENEELKNIILEETPWFFTAQKQSERLQNIGKLFKPQRMKNQVNSLVVLLQLNQNVNGSWGWFSGLSESMFITQHIVAGMGHLKVLGVSIPKCRLMLSRAKNYLDSEHLKAYEERLRDTVPYCFNNLDAHYLYARSFDYDSTFLKQPFVRQYLEEAQKDIYERELYTQASLALVFHRFGITALAQDIMESIRQQAFKNEQMGMYWKTHSGSYYRWYQAPVERQALFIEAFSEIAPNAEEIEMMKLWLIKQKQTQAWSNTKATANAAYALLLHGSNLLSNGDDVTIKVGKQSFNPSEMEDVEAGTGYFKTTWPADEIKSEMAQIELHKPSKGSAYGTVYWQYFEDLDKITSVQTDLSLEKKLYKIIVTSVGEELQEITEDQPLKIGDKVVVRMILKTDRDLEYVHLKDLRASAFEPLNVFTTTKTQSGLQYTEATRDAATNFFFSNMPKGNYVFEYRLIASQKGGFSNGIATIQCMYAPEFSAQSEEVRIVVND